MPLVRRIPGNQNPSGRKAGSGEQLYGRERKPAQLPGIGMQVEKAVHREQSKSRGHPDNAGGFDGGGETCTARKSYAKEMRGESIYVVRRPSKMVKREKLIIRFSNEDYEGIYLPHADALVVAIMIVSHKIHRVLVDNGSSADILYKSAFDLMKIDKEKVSAFQYPLVGFAGEQVMPLGSIELQVTVGTPPTQKSIPVKFLIVDRPSAYNAIFGRTAKAELKAVTSIPHLSMKFPTEDGVGVVRGEQRAESSSRMLQRFFKKYF